MFAHFPSHLAKRSLLTMTFSNSVRYSSSITREDYLKAKKMVPKKVGCGHANYNQRKNASTILWASLAVTDPNLMKVLVDKNWYVQGGSNNIVTFCELLGPVPIRTRVINVDSGVFEDGTGRDLYMNVMEQGRYNANTKPSKVVSDYIRERIYKEVKPGIPFVSPTDFFNAIGVDLVQMLKKGVLESVKVAISKEQTEKAINQVINNVADRGFEKLEDFASERSETAGKAVSKTQEIYHIMQDGALSTDKKWIVELTCYTPPLRPELRNRSVYRFDKDVVCLEDIAAILKEHIKQDSKPGVVSKLKSHLENLKDLDQLKTYYTEAR